MREPAKQACPGFVEMFREVSLKVKLSQVSEAIVSISAANPEQTIHYDGDQAHFVPGPLN